MNKPTIIVISLIIGLVAIFISLFPVWYASKHVPIGSVFTGQASWFDPWDINVYVAAVNWGQHHGFLMENMYTSQTNPGIVYYPLYTLAGVLIPKANPFLVFYSFSVLSTFALTFVLVLVVQKIVTGFYAVTVTVASILFAGGFGFLVFPYLNSLDVTMTAVTFHSAIQRPHEAIALGCYILALMAFYFSTQQKFIYWKLTAFFSLIFAMALYPYYILSFFSIVAVYILLKFGWSWLLQNAPYIASLGLGAFGMVLLEYLNLRSNYSFSGVVGQQLSNPTVLPFALSYGLLAIPFIFQLIKMRPLGSTRLFLTIWVVVSVISSLLPIGIARFYLRGMFFPLVLLAVLVIKYIFELYFSGYSEKKLIIALIYLLLCITPTTASVFLGRINETTKQNKWFYMSKDQRDTLSFIDSALPKQRVILSEYYVGNLIPALTDQRVYFGHMIQTPDAQSKQKELAKFYSGKMNQAEVEKFLDDNHIDYIYWGEEEAQSGKLSPQLDQFPYQFFTKIYSNQTVAVFQARE